MEATGAEPVVADVESLDAGRLAEVLGGHDAVVWSAGAGGGSPERTYAVDRDAAIASMDAAARAGITRYVMVSYFGAAPDHGVAEDNPFFAYAEAKAAADEHLRGTDLDWTVLGPSGADRRPVHRTHRHAGRRVRPGVPRGRGPGRRRRAERARHRAPDHPLQQRADADRRRSEGRRA